MLNPKALKGFKGFGWSCVFSTGLVSAARDIRAASQTTQRSGQRHVAGHMGPWTAPERGKAIGGLIQPGFWGLLGVKTHRDVSRL